MRMNTKGLFRLPYNTTITKGVSADITNCLILSISSFLPIKSCGTVPIWPEKIIYILIQRESDIIWDNGRRETIEEERYVTIDHAYRSSNMRY